MKTTKFVPTGGYGFADGTVATRSNVNAAIKSYARRHGYFARTVRDITSLKRAAMDAWKAKYRAAPAADAVPTPPAAPNPDRPDSYMGPN